MALIVKNYSFSAGATILAAEHNDNFDTIYSEFNGNIDNSNIKANAAIVDTKLAQITTASKVSTSALTGQILDASLGGAVKTGTNSTITAITGLTMPLAINQGGTSQTTANTALNALLPTQTTSSGSYLTTDGTNTIWGSVTIPISSATTGDNLLISSDAEHSTTSTSYVLVKSIGLVRSGSYRIKFTLGSSWGSSPTTGYGRIYRNNVAVGTERSVVTGPTEYSEDITGWTAGDTCQIYAKRSGGDGSMSSDITNFRIYSGTYSIETVITA